MIRSFMGTSRNFTRLVEDHDVVARGRG